MSGSGAPKIDSIGQTHHTTKMDARAEMALHLSFLDAAFPPDYPDAMLFTLEQLGGLRNTVSVILDQVEAL
jgi:hypothetical protein